MVTVICAGYRLCSSRLFGGRFLFSGRFLCCAWLRCGLLLRSGLLFGSGLFLCCCLLCCRLLVFFGCRSSSFWFGCRFFNRCGFCCRRNGGFGCNFCITNRKRNILFFYYCTLSASCEHNDYCCQNNYCDSFHNIASFAYIVLPKTDLDKDANQPIGTTSFSLFCKTLCV